MTPKKKTDWSPESFPEPRTFPSGWDGTALSSANGRRQTQEDENSQTNTNDADGWMPEKFPKPRTYPKSWSVDD